MNSLFSIFGGGQQQGPQTNNEMNTPIWNNPAQMAQALQSMMTDPSAFLKANGYNVPASMAGNPQQIISHLVQTGQVGNNVVQAAMNAVGNNPALQSMLGLMGKR